MISRVTKYGLRALLGLAGLYALAISAGAQSREIFGYAGVLGEWEIIAAVAHFGAPVDNEGSNSRRFPEVEQKCPAPQTYLNEQTASLCGREREVSAGRPNGLQEALSYSMTSSARTSSVGGILMPRAFAVFRLIASSNFVGCSTGKFSGRSPRRSLCTSWALRRKMSGVCAP